MNKAYERINWHNKPSTATKLNATNLNKMDLGLDTIDDRVIALDTNKADTSSIVTEISGLNDVNISSPANNQVLKYDSTNDEWVNANESGGSVVTVTQKTTTGTNIADITVDGTTTQIFAPTSGGASSLSGLSDVDIVNPTDGQILKYDNTEQKWINNDVVLDIDDLDNVSITSPSNNQVLKYDSVNDVWKNANESGGGGGSTVAWNQLQSTGTKIAEISIDGTSTDVYAPSGGGGGLVDRTFNVASTDWEANTDPTTETDYPYIAEITTSVYSNTSKPIWQMNGVGTIPTLAEQEEIGYIIEAVFSSSGITLYAIDEPTVALVLEVKGE